MFVLYESNMLCLFIDSYFMVRDLNMYDEVQDMPMQARNKALNEQLG